MTFGLGFLTGRSPQVFPFYKEMEIAPSLFPSGNLVCWFDLQSMIKIPNPQWEGLSVGGAAESSGKRSNSVALIHSP